MSLARIIKIVNPETDQVQYPITLAELVLYDDNTTVKDKLDNIETDDWCIY